jgi:hypothetical protein
VLLKLYHRRGAADHRRILRRLSHGEIKHATSARFQLLSEGTGSKEGLCVGCFTRAAHLALLLKALPYLGSIHKVNAMAKKARKRKYSKSAGRTVASEMRRYKKGKAKSGRGGKGGKVKSRKQALAIGLSKARKKGKKVPKKKS